MAESHPEVIVSPKSSGDPRNERCQSVHGCFLLSVQQTFLSKRVAGTAAGLFSIACTHPFEYFQIR